MHARTHVPSGKGFEIVSVPLHFALRRARGGRHALPAHPHTPPLSGKTCSSSRAPCVRGGLNVCSHVRASESEREREHLALCAVAYQIEKRVCLGDIALVWGNYCAPSALQPANQARRQGNVLFTWRVSNLASWYRAGPYDNTRGLMRWTRATMKSPMARLPMPRRDFEGHRGEAIKDHARQRL